MTTTTTKQEQAIKNVAAGIGSLVWWTLRGTAITPDDMRTIMADEGDDPSIVPDLDEAREIRRAARGWTKGKGKADRFRASFPKGTEDDPDTVEVSILRKGGGRGEFLHFDTVVFDVPSQTWTNPGTTTEAQEFRAKADLFRTHLDHDWLRPHLLVKRLKAMSTVTIKDDGGLYYVPGHSHDAELDKLKRIIRRVGSSRLSSLRITASDTDAIADVKEATRGTLDNKLSGIVEKLTRWTQSTRAVSETHAVETLGQLRDLKAQADLYRDALGLALDDLDAAMADAETTARTILSDVQEAATGEVDKQLRNDLAVLITVFVVDGVATVNEAQARTHNVPTNTYAFWNTGNGDGRATAKSLGYDSRLSKADGKVVLTLTAIEADAEPAPAPAPKPTPEPEPMPAEPAPVAEVIELPKPEPKPAPTVDPKRAKLESMDDARLAGMYRAVTGTMPDMSRDEIIDAILDAVA